MKLFIYNILNNMKIKTKLIVTYLSIVTITVFIVGVYLTSKMNTVVIENSKKEASYNNDTIKYRLQQVLNFAITTSDMVYRDEKLHSLVKHHYNNPGEVVDAYNNYTILNDYLRYYDGIDKIRFYVDNPTLLNNSNIIKTSNSTKKSEWYGKSLNDKGIITWYYKLDEITKKYNLSLIRSIYSSNNELIGVLVISIKPSILNDIVADENYLSSILLDGVVISSNNLEVGSIQKFKEAPEEGSYYLDRIDEFNKSNNFNIINTFKIDKSFNNTFQTLVTIPVDIITKESNNIIHKSMLIILLAILFSLIIILYFSKNFYDRMNILKKEMHKVVEGNFNIKKSINGCDEISEVYDDLYVMVESINKLIDEVYVKEIQEEQLIAKQREAEFKMLASQINPHFLYNTLETIRMRCFCNGDRELATIVKKLGKIMRRNLEVSDRNVTLESELELIKNYLEIQSLRFGEKFKYEFNIDVNLNKYLILPLLLQPIVENSFVHGLERMKGIGEITINIWEDFGYLIIEISDNGIGISKERLDFINDNLNKSNKKNGDHQSIGLSNINERIKIFYGDKYGLYVFSQLNVGTKVTVILPAIKEDIELC